MANVAAGEQHVADATFIGVLDDSAGFKQTASALSALGAYADALNALATANYGTEVDKAATALYGSLTAIDKDATRVSADAKIPDADFGILGTLVKAIGDVAARDKQAAAVKKAVTMADSGVQAICKGVGNDLDGLRSTYIKNLDVIYTAEFTAYQHEFETSEKDSAAHPKQQASVAFGTRLARLQEIRVAKLSERNADQFLAKLIDSAKSLAVAHARIEQSLMGSKITLADVTRAVGELKSYADELKRFNASLAKGTP